MSSSKRDDTIDQIRVAVEQCDTEVDILQAAVEIIDRFSGDFNWTGFYMLRGDILEVGPYIGPVTEHTHIPLHRGICGAAASQKKSIIVDDVRSDSRFLACSTTTRSEIVVPLLDGDQVIGEIDIDSDQPASFTTDDRTMLEQIAAIVVSRLKAIRTIGQSER